MIYKDGILFENINIIIQSMVEATRRNKEKEDWLKLFIVKEFAST